MHQLADYSGSCYQAMLRQFCVLFCVTIGFAVLALAMEFVPAPEGSAAARVCEFLRGLGMGMSIGMLVVGALVTSGRMERCCAAKHRVLKKLRGGTEH